MEKVNGFKNRPTGPFTSRTILPRTNPRKATFVPQNTSEVEIPSGMAYNVVNDLTKLQITLPFLEVVKIPQQKENTLKVLGNEDKHNTRVDAVVMDSQQQCVGPLTRTRGKIPPFFISLETHKLILHNCMVNSGATNNTMSLLVMEVVGLECTEYYEAGESIHASDSRKVPTYGEIKDFCVSISSAPHNKTMFSIILVDLSTTYGVVLGRE
jgi:hypothetical protein